MKKLLLIPVLFLLLISCSNNSDEETQPNLLIGEWKLSEKIIDDGGGTNPVWMPITDGYDFVFLEDNKFYTTKFLGTSGCAGGTYTVVNSVITLTFYCPNTTIPNKFKIYSNTSNELIIGNINCDEGCEEKLKRIN